YINMGRQLYETQPVFRQTLNQCCEILETYLDKPLLEILYGDEASENVLAQTAYTQVALFAIEYALYKLWSSWGIKPSVVMGHSVGEYVAATIAGVLSLEDGFKLIAHRGRLMQQLPPGGEMLSVMASVEQINQIVTPYSQEVTIAAINGPVSVVISGEAKGLGTVKEKLDSLKIKTKQLQVSHGFHSHLMEPMLAEFKAITSEITYNQPSIPLLSNVTGVKADESIATPDYWVNHLLKPVKFAQSMETLHQEGYEVFLEIGPKPTLLGMGRQCLPEDVGVWLPSLRSEREDWQQMLQSLGELYVRGVKVDWLGFDKDYSRKKVILPTYPFQRQRYWIETEKNQQTGTQDLIEEKDNIIKNRRDKIIQELNSLIFQVLGFDASSEIDIHDNLLEMGADSLTLMEVGSKVEKTYGINIPIRKFFEELTTLDALATYIDVNLSPQWGIQSQLEETLQQSTQSQSENNSIEPRIGEKVFETFREGIIQQQLEVMSHIMSKQLEVLQNNGTSTEQSLSTKNKQFQSASATSSTVDSFHKIQQNQIFGKESSPPNFELSQALNIEQKTYLEKFIAAYTIKTQKSKQRALAYRSVLADKKAVVGFRFELKEMKYPIVGESSSGSRIWDIDGNEYIDISMGFGVHLFGHQPQFIVEALQNQLKKGMQIGPQSQLSGEVAQLVHELTGMERVAFCNSGTEAIMTALRIARLTTGRDKIVMFSGAYHGQFDGTLAVPLPNSLDGNFKAAPMLPGVLQKMVDDVIVLRYGAAKSLDIIKAYSHELAAVLVEPVQSRQPDLQPKEFLQ
ncbi:MAG: aminotransferase class III-fold pyridoxal phosphate-dependent enzyme, partial [Cyanobacteria bacterium P01_F01_bin.143]